MLRNIHLTSYVRQYLKILEYKTGNETCPQPYDTDANSHIVFSVCQTPQITAEKSDSPTCTTISQGSLVSFANRKRLREIVKCRKLNSLYFMHEEIVKQTGQQQAESKMLSSLLNQIVSKVYVRHLSCQLKSEVVKLI